MTMKVVIFVKSDSQPEGHHDGANLVIVNVVLIQIMQHVLCKPGGVFVCEKPSRIVLAIATNESHDSTPFSEIIRPHF